MEAKSPVKTRPARHLLWIVPLLLSLAVTVWAVLLAGRWLRSEECRSLLESRASSALHARTEFDQIELQWLGLASRRIAATGDAGGVLKTLKAEGLQADIRPSSLLKGYWDVEQIVMERLHLHFGAPDAAQVPNLQSADGTARTSGWFPSRTVISVVHGKRTDILFELPGKKCFLLDGTRLEGHPGQDESRIELRGGILTSSEHPDLALTLGTARWILSPKGAELCGADLSSPSGGRISLSGTLREGMGSSRLQCDWKELPVAVLLPKAADRISGDLSGVASFSWTKDGLYEGDGKIGSTDLILHGIPALERIADVTGLEGFRYLRVARFQTRFSMRNGTTRWEDVLLESPDFLKITGTAVTTKEGGISGSFRFGITTRIVNMVPFARELLALEESAGYIWLRDPVLVSGSLSHPEENLSPRIAMLLATGANGVLRNGIRTGMDLLGIKQEDPGAGQTPATPSTNGPAGEVEKSGNQLLRTVEGLLK